MRTICEGMNVSDLIKELTDNDDKKAYARVKEITAASAYSPAYYESLDLFASLLQHKKSYIRTHAFVLCCSQARWDEAGKLKQLLPALLELLHDPKPTVVRQCLNAVKEMIAFQPGLCETIRYEVEQIDLGQYQETMRPLIQKDIHQILEIL